MPTGGRLVGRGRGRWINYGKHNRPMEFRILSHAAMWVRCGGTSVVIDPWLVGFVLLAVVVELPSRRVRRARDGRGGRGHPQPPALGSLARPEPAQAVRRQAGADSRRAGAAQRSRPADDRLSRRAPPSARQDGRDRRAAHHALPVRPLRRRLRRSWWRATASPSSMRTTPRSPAGRCATSWRGTGRSTSRSAPIPRPTRGCAGGSKATRPTWSTTTSTTCVRSCSSWTRCSRATRCRSLRTIAICTTTCSGYNEMIATPLELREHVRSLPPRRWALQVMLPGSHWQKGAAGQPGSFDLAPETPYDDMPATFAHLPRRAGAGLGTVSAAGKRRGRERRAARALSRLLPRIPSPAAGAAGRAEAGAALARRAPPGAW